MRLVAWNFSFRLVFTLESAFFRFGALFDIFLAHSVPNCILAALRPCRRGSCILVLCSLNICIISTSRHSVRKSRHNQRRKVFCSSTISDKNLREDFRPRMTSSIPSVVCRLRLRGNSELLGGNVCSAFRNLLRMSFDSARRDLSRSINTWKNTAACVFVEALSER
jgi:hypothetical protein